MWPLVWMFYGGKVKIRINRIQERVFRTLDPLTICDAFRDLAPFVQVKKREKHPQRSVTSSKVASCSLQLY